MFGMKICFFLTSQSYTITDCPDKLDLMSCTTMQNANVLTGPLSKSSNRSPSSYNNKVNPAKIPAATAPIP
jgi:hypothetical protein